jgi:nucleoside-diphosphate-sugar epimerase
LALVLVVGATGMTGLCLVEQLLERGHEVRLVVRSAEKLSPAILNNPHTTVIKAAVLDFSDQEMSDHVRGCDAVVSCLGHVMDFNGMLENLRNCVPMRHVDCVALSKQTVLQSVQSLF